ncbi:MAG TPA: hypothetical protein VGL36_04925 [Kribbella sp.]
MTGPLAKWTGAGMRAPRRAEAEQEPSREEVLAAQRVVDLFATEALLALDRYEQSLPADASDKARRTADRFAHWWHKLELDGVRLDRAGTDAEQVLAQVSDLALDPDNEWGVSLEEASGLAASEAAIAGRPVPEKGIADFRKEFEQAYGGHAGEPSNDAWLADSLTRFARASLLRDVVESGAKTRVSGPLRAAADDLVRQGRQLIDDRGKLDRSIGRRPGDKVALRDAEERLTVPYVLLSVGLQAGSAPLPPMVGVASQAVVLGMYLNNLRQVRREHREAAATQVDPAAQDRLLLDRGGLVDTLGTPPPATRRDIRTLRNATERRNGPSR